MSEERSVEAIAAVGVPPEAGVRVRCDRAGQSWLVG